MQSPRLALLPLGLVGALSAQGVTSPKGYDTIEGNTQFFHWVSTRRLQSIDNTQVGAPLVTKSIAFRRDAAGGGNTGTARTLNASVDMGRGTWGVQSTLMDDNFVAGSRTNVFTYKPVNMPDWTSAPSTPPAAFDFTMVYDTPWVYIGVDALVWSVSYDSGPTGFSTTDRQYVGLSALSSTGTVLGTGCLATGMASNFTNSSALVNAGPSIGMALTTSAANAPANTPVTMFLDATTSNLNITGLCSTLYAVPSVQLLIGTASATGAVASKVLQVPYNAGIVGGTVVTQFVAVDGGQAGLPFALSTGRQLTMPANTTTGMQCAYQWSTLPTSTSTVFYGGSIVAFLGT